jgi:hypothetical protein
VKLTISLFVVRPESVNDADQVTLLAFMLGYEKFESRGLGADCCLRSSQSISLGSNSSKGVVCDLMLVYRDNGIK